MSPTTRSDWESAYAQLSAGSLDEKIASAKTLDELEALRVHILGRKGPLTNLLKDLKDLSLDDKRSLGPQAQKLKADLETRLAERKQAIESAQDEASLMDIQMDVTLPAKPASRGRIHPLTATMDEMTQILNLMGFSCAEGPLVESEHYNFEALNIPEHHAARDMHDTFYLRDLPFLLRTHTSPVQIRTMESQKPPVRVICPGRVFRHEAIDAAHAAVFHQIEGLAVDEGVTFADLKGTIQTFLQRLFGAKTRTRFRPSYFPFTEPSAEVDVQCLLCNGSGCPACKRSGWIEIMGAGMVHPNVFKAVGYDPEKVSGFAFGMGVERIAILRLGVPDMRLFYDNDLRFLKQFDESLI